MTGASRPRWRQLFRWPPRRSDLVISVLLAALGFAAVAQLRAVQDEGPLAGARQEDLVQILDDLSNRDQRLRAEIERLNEAQERLSSGSGRSEAALEEARRRAQLLGVLAGTLPARGPGIRLTIVDPDALVGAEVLLDTLAELRDAGAEAVQVEGPVDPGGGAVPGSPGPVRVVASTSFVDDGQGAVLVDDVPLRAPFRFSVFGDPDTMAAAVEIPGGVVDTVEQRGGRVLVERRDDLLVGALRPLEPPRYARPAPDEGS